MNRNRNHVGVGRPARPSLWVGLWVALLSLTGCHRHSILSNAATLKEAASAPEYESLVLQANDWESSTPPPPGTPEGDLRVAESLFRAEDYAKAAKAFEEVADKHKDKPDVHERALYMKAESQYQHGQFNDAYNSFQEFVKAYPGSRHLAAAMQRIFAIADFWLEDARRDVRRGKPSAFRRFLNLDSDKKPVFDVDGHAVHALDYVREHDPNGPLADDTLMMVAGYQFSMGDYREADSLFDRLVHDYPRSEHQAQAHLMSAESKLQSYQGSAYDGRKLEEARTTLRAALTQFSDELEPERPRIMQELDEIRQEQAKSQFEIAEWYRRMGDRQPKKADTFYRSARIYYQYVQKSFAGTKWAARAGERLADLPQTPPAQADAAGQESAAKPRS